MITDAVDNYATFPPLGTILVVMLGVAVADRVGHALRDAAGRRRPRTGSLADVHPGLHRHGRPRRERRRVRGAGPARRPGLPSGGPQPDARRVVAFVSVAAGYDASPLVTPMDAVLAGLTTAAAHTVDPEYVVTPLSQLLLLHRLLRRPGRRHHPRHREGAHQAGGGDARGRRARAGDRTPAGRRRAGRADPAARGAARAAQRGPGRCSVTPRSIVVAMVPAGSPLRGEGGSIVESPVLTGIAVVLGVLFLLARRRVRAAPSGTVRERPRHPGLHGARACARWPRSWCCSSPSPSSSPTSSGRASARCSRSGARTC